MQIGLIWLMISW